TGLWFNRWGSLGPGPAWAQIRTTTPEVSQISDALAANSIRHHALPQTAEVLVPLPVLVGAELSAVESDLRRQLTDLAQVLDAIDAEVVEVVDGPEGPDEPPPAAGTGA